MTKVHELSISNNRFVFVWALQHLISIGSATCGNYTDEQIKEYVENERERQSKLDGISLYTPEIVGDMLSLAREFANIPFDKLITQLANEDLFENEERPIKYDRLKDIASCAVGFMNKDDADEFKITLDIDEDEEEFLNY